MAKEEIQMAVSAASLGIAVPAGNLGDLSRSIRTVHDQFSLAKRMGCFAQAKLAHSHITAISLPKLSPPVVNLSTRGSHMTYYDVTNRYSNAFNQANAAQRTIERFMTPLNTIDQALAPVRQIGAAIDQAMAPIREIERSLNPIRETLNAFDTLSPAARFVRDPIFNHLSPRFAYTTATSEAAAFLSRHRDTVSQALATRDRIARTEFVTDQIRAELVRPILRRAKFSAEETNQIIQGVTAELAARGNSGVIEAGRDESLIQEVRELISVQNQFAATLRQSSRRQTGWAIASIVIALLSNPYVPALLPDDRSTRSIPHGLPAPQEIQPRVVHEVCAPDLLQDTVSHDATHPSPFAHEQSTEAASLMCEDPETY